MVHMRRHRGLHETYEASSVLLALLGSVGRPADFLSFLLPYFPGEDAKRGLGARCEAKGVRRSDARATR